MSGEELSQESHRSTNYDVKVPWVYVVSIEDIRGLEGCLQSSLEDGDTNR